MYRLRHGHRDSLSGMDGILKVTVDYATETIDIEYNPEETDSAK